MSKYSFSPAERYAVFTVHGERCYLCKKPVDLATMEIDHVIPEELLGSDELTKILKNLGRPDGFNINGFENWSPACKSCNNTKSNAIFEPSPIIQIHLQKLEEKKKAALAAKEETVSSRKISNAINTLARCELENIDTNQIRQIEPLFEYHFKNPHRASTDSTIRISPLLEVLSEDGSIQIVRGPYGVGSGPVNASSSMRCPTCGGTAFNGALCIICGQKDDD